MKNKKDGGGGGGCCERRLLPGDLFSPSSSGPLLSLVSPGEGGEGRPSLRGDSSSKYHGLAEAPFPRVPAVGLRFLSVACVTDREPSRAQGPRPLAAGGIQGEPSPCLPRGYVLTPGLASPLQTECPQDARWGWKAGSACLLASPQPFTCPDTDRSWCQLGERGAVTGWRESPAEGRQDKGLGVPAAPPGMEAELAGIQVSLQIRSKCTGMARLPLDRRRGKARPTSRC